MSDYTPHQQKIINNYYKNLDAVKGQRLAELVSEIYLTTGKKQERAWQQAAAALKQIGMPEARIEHLVNQRRPELLAEVVQGFQDG